MVRTIIEARSGGLQHFHDQHVDDGEVKSDGEGVLIRRCLRDSETIAFSRGDHAHEPLVYTGIPITRMWPRVLEHLLVWSKVAGLRLSRSEYCTVHHSVARETAALGGVQLPQRGLRPYRSCWPSRIRPCWMQPLSARARWSSSAFTDTDANPSDHCAQSIGDSPAAQRHRG